MTSPVHSQTSHLAIGNQRVALIDLLDRVLGGGVVIAGEVTLAIEEVDLVHISLRALIGSAGTLRRLADG
jgi:hypothetical protein